MNAPMLFNMPATIGTPKRFVRTTYTDERELISDILWLHNAGQGVDVDPCYSVGRFWRGLPEPKHKFDIEPQSPLVQKADSANLPLDAGQVKSIMFDPPFLVGVGTSDNGIITGRFSGFRTLSDLKAMYIASLKEFFRILENDGLLIFKCQDTVTSNKQFLTHVFVINEAEKAGFFSKDLFVLINDMVINDPKWKAQKHARKTHSYFLVFRKVHP